VQPVFVVYRVNVVCQETLALKVHSVTMDPVHKASKETPDLTELLEQIQLDPRVTRVTKVMMGLFRHLN
jgi:hypothetical protein